MTGTTSPGLSGPGSNGNEGILHTHQICKTGVHYQMHLIDLQRKVKK